MILNKYLDFTSSFSQNQYTTETDSFTCCGVEDDSLTTLIVITKLIGWFYNLWLIYTKDLIPQEKVSLATPKIEP